MFIVENSTKAKDKADSTEITDSGSSVEMASVSEAEAEETVFVFEQEDSVSSRRQRRLSVQKGGYTSGNANTDKRISLPAKMRTWLAREASKVFRGGGATLDDLPEEPCEQSERDGVASLSHDFSSQVEKQVSIADDDGSASDQVVIPIRDSHDQIPTTRSSRSNSLAVQSGHGAHTSLRVCSPRPTRSQSVVVANFLDRSNRDSDSAATAIYRGSDLSDEHEANNRISFGSASLESAEELEKN